MNCPPATQQDLLNLLTRSTDPGWLSGMLNQPDGHAIVNAWLAIFARASVAVSGQVDCSMIATAPTGSPGNCTLTLQRTSTGTTGTIPKGYTFVTNLKTALTVETDVPIGSGQTTVAIPLVTVRQIDLVNTALTAFDDLVSVGSYPDAILGTNNPAPPLDSSGNALLGGSHVAGYSLTYVSSTAITGASSDGLSVHGAERACFRQAGEDGEAYRARVRLIPDAVSPNAVARAVDGPAGILPTRWLAEPFNDGADSDVRLALNLGWFDSPFCDVDFADDWLGIPASGEAVDKRPIATLETPGMRESRAYCCLDLVGELQDPDGFLLYADAGYCDDTSWGFPDVGVPVVGSGLGVHPVIGSASDALFEELRAKLAGGVEYDVYLEDSTQLQAHNGSLSAGGGGAVAWTLTPTAGTTWMLREGLVTGDDGAPLVAGQGVAVKLTFADTTTLQTPWSTVALSLRSFELQALGYRGQPITQIQGLGMSSPPSTLNVVGSFAVSTSTT